MGLQFVDRTIFVELADTRAKHEYARKGDPPAHTVDDRGARKVLKTDFLEPTRLIAME